MKRMILYTSRYGFTADVAAALRSKLGAETTDLFDLAIDGAIDPAPYDVVVLGSSIYMGSVPRAMRQYVHRYASVLEGKRYALFICAGHPNPSTRMLELRSVFAPLSADRAAAKAVLGYAVSYGKLNLADRFIAKAIKAEEARQDPSPAELQQFANEVLAR